MDPDLKEQILDLIYDLLPEDQVESLRVRIDTEPEVRAIYESFMRKNRLLEEATRLEPEKSLFSALVAKEQEKPAKSQLPSPAEQEADASVAVTHYGKSTQYIHAPHPKKHGFQWITQEIARRALGEERGINRMVSVGAICLILLSFLGYVFQKQQVDKLSEQSYLYRIVAPPVLVNDQTQSLQIQVSDLVGRPQQIPIRVAINSLSGEKLLAQTQKTDSQGNMLVNLDPRKELPEEVELEVFLGENPDKKIVSRIPVLKRESQFVVALDKPVYTPEDHVRYRAFNMSQSVPASEHKKLDRELARRSASPQQPQETLNVWISNENPGHMSALGTLPETSAGMGMGGASGSGLAAKMEGRSMPGSATESTINGSGGRSGQQPRVLYSLQNSIQMPVNPSQQVITGSVPLDNPPDTDFGTMFLNIRPEQSQSQLIQTPIQVARQSTQSDSLMAKQIVLDSKFKLKAESFHNPVPLAAHSRSTPESPSMVSSSSPTPQEHDSFALHEEQAAKPSTLFVEESPEQPVPELDVAPCEPIAACEPTTDNDLIAEWVPGGGHLVLGLENTVYFKANRHFKGNLIDQTGKTIVPVETGPDCYGKFRWTPKSGNFYQIQLSGKEHSDERIPLDLKYESLPVSLDIEQAILASDQSIVVNLNARHNDIPVIVTVVKQGIPILAQAWILGQGLNLFEVPLPVDADGLLDVLVLDGTSDSNTPLQLLAWQSIFRRPGQYLVINTKSKVTPLQNDNASWNFDIQILNESGKPATFATVGINVIQDRTNNAISREILSQQMTLTDQLFFSALPVEDWKWFDSLVRLPEVEAESETATRLKFLFAKDRSDIMEMDEQTLAAIHPLVYDNFSQLQSQYHEKVLHFQNARNSWMRVFMIISIFGGMGFAVLVMILVTMRLASAVRMFVLTAIVGLSCVFLCLAMLKNQVNFSEAFRRTTFVSHKMKEKEVSSFQENVTGEDAQQDHLTLLEQISSTQQSRPFQALSSRNNVSNHSSAVSFENIFWQPELKTDAQGHVAFDFLVTEAKDTTIQIVIDTFDENGRIGSCRIDLPADKKEE